MLSTIRKGKKGSKKKGEMRLEGQQDANPSPPVLVLSPISPSIPVDCMLPTSVNAWTRDQVSQHAVMASITGGTFEDVKFFTFSRRTRSGKVDTPCALFGNSSLIRKASSHFDFVLTRGFAESGLTDMDAPFPRNLSACAENYDYASDSDLEDESESEDLCRIEDTDVKDKEERSENASKDSIKAAETSSNGGYTSADNHAVRRGRVVFVEDIAYRTWKAFLFYAFFGTVSFASLKSQAQDEGVEKNPYGPPSCSPKSMFRLAEKYGIEDLKRIAAKDITSKLSHNNILTEIFSPFTLLHPEIKALEISYLHEHIHEPALASRLPRWFHYLQNGELPDGAADVFGELVNKVVSIHAKTCPNGCKSSARCNNCGCSFD